ncbi:MAG: ATP:cob(I)alamin adenosyltransferase, partial [Gammaproteobacteria bacterium]|nr:ATP:cob(I)alamin adenosyltransferase [Gammaproteobacteria bacterium]
MGQRLSKIVTKTGDNGTTGLADGSRRKKNDIRIHCLGEVDELNAIIGICSSLIEHQQVQTTLLQIQHDLFD